MNDLVLVADPTSWQKLDQFANRLRHELFPLRGDEPLPVPIEEVIEFRLPEFDCDLAVVEALPSSVEACVDWDPREGRFKLVLPEEAYQGMHNGDGRARFTATHEFAHLVLHGEKIRKAAGASTPSGLFRTSHDVPRYRNAERQADVFASRFLLPEEVVLQAIQTHGPNIGLLADTLQVSFTAMERRMGELRGRW